MAITENIVTSNTLKALLENPVARAELLNELKTRGPRELRNAAPRILGRAAAGALVTNVLNQAGSYAGGATGSSGGPLGTLSGAAIRKAGGTIVGLGLTGLATYGDISDNIHNQMNSVRVQGLSESAIRAYSMNSSQVLDSVISGLGGSQ